MEGRAAGTEQELNSDVWNIEPWLYSWKIAAVIFPTFPAPLVGDSGNSAMNK